MADIFVSYTSSDREWAFWIANELQTLGHSPHVHEWEIKSGEDIYAWMERHHDAADHVLCVVSDEYLKAPYSTLERSAALWHAASKRPGFVLLVAVKACRLPTLADHLRRCELFNIPEDEARSRFQDFMAKREAPLAFVFPGQYAVSNIPIRVPTHFVGRNDALADIETALKRYEGRVAITALHGLRGVGKTTLAAAYAERHRGEYRATWWIRAQTAPTMRADLVGLGIRLKWLAADEKEEPALAIVMDRLRQEGEGILLIYDNAVDTDALRPYLPRGGRAHVLVTSNAHAWRGVAQPVEIRLWPQEIGADYLIVRTGREAERDAALALSEALGGLPLAHEQAAAYCERLAISLAEYRKRFEAAPARLLDDARHAPAEYHDGLTVAKTFALAIDEAAKLHPAAEPLIVHAALLAPEPIPLFLFAEAREKFGEPLAAALDGDRLDEAVAALRTFALVDRETIVDERDPSITTECIRVHRLLRQIAQARCDESARVDVLRNLISALAAVYPADVWEHSTNWPRARRLDALAIEQFDAERRPSGTNEQFACLLDGLASYRLWAREAYGEARPLFERALTLREEALGPRNPLTVESLERLAYAFECEGDLARARTLFERALTINEEALGPDHPDTATSMTFLAGILDGQDDPASARRLYERAVTIHEKASGQSAGMAMTFNNFACFLRDQGDLISARRMFERALALRENVLGHDHIDTAETLTHFALLLMRLGEFPRARDQWMRALATYERDFGHEHAKVGTCLNNLAAALRDQGDIHAAELRCRRALTILEKKRDPADPSLNRVRCNLATICLAAGHPGEALSLGEAALAAHDKAVGANHAWTKDSTRVTADALDALGRAEEARALRERYGIPPEQQSKTRPSHDPT